MASHSSAAFSPSMTLAGMDYIAPSAACIKPTLMANAKGSGAGDAPSATPGAESGVVGVTRGGNALSTNPGFQHADVVKITLQDCLACSGCVTTAETVLVNSQSRHEIVAALLAPEGLTAPDAGVAAPSRQRPRLVTVSSQSCASLAAYLGVPVSEAYAIVAGFMRAVLTPDALRDAAARAAASQAVDAGAGADEEQVELVSDGAPQPCAPAASEPPVFVAGLEWAEQLSATLTAQEYERRRQQHTTGAGDATAPLPLIVSACPGWVCYCEKQGSSLLPHLCPVMSAQGIAGSYAKRAVAADAYHISIQPCFDRKLEAARDSMPATTTSLASSPGADEVDAQIFYTDCVLSTAELLEWMKEVNPALPWRGALDTDDTALHFRGNVTLGEAEEDARPTEAVVSAHAHDAARLAGSGSYHQCVMAHRLSAAGVQAGGSAAAITYAVKRNHNHQLATSEGLPGEVFCLGYGFQQIQNVVRGIKKRTPAMRSYTFIELMACPDGCLNGGGQIRPAQQPHAEVLAAVIDVFARHTTSAVTTTSDIGKARGDTANEEAMLTQRRRVECEPTSHLTRPFADATIAAVAPALGEGLWRCSFRDREKEFAEMLNAGNVHSLKW